MNTFNPKFAIGEQVFATAPVHGNVPGFPAITKAVVINVAAKAEVRMVHPNGTKVRFDKDGKPIMSDSYAEVYKCNFRYQLLWGEVWVEEFEIFRTLEEAKTKLKK